MFTKKDKRSDLEKERDNAVLVLKTLAVGTEEYSLALEQVEKLNEMLMAEKDHENKFSADGLLGVGSQLAGILLVLNYEHARTITSKALGFITKGRVR